MSFNLDIIEQPVNLTEGQWVGDIPNHPGVRFKVRSRAYKPFEAAHDRLVRSFGKRVSVALSTPEYKAQVGKLFADHILLDWENAVTQGGKSAGYNKKLAAQILTSIDERGMGNAFRDAVAYASGIVADIHLGQIEDIAGN